MIRALYANGMIGGDDLKREIDGINSHCDSAIRNIHRVYGVSDHVEQEEENYFSDNPPLLAKVSPVAT